MKPSKRIKILNKYRRAVERLENLVAELEDQKFPDTCEAVRSVIDARFILLRFPVQLDASIPERDKLARFTLKDCEVARDD